MNQQTQAINHKIKKGKSWKDKEPMHILMRIKKN